MRINDIEFRQMEERRPEIIKWFLSDNKEVCFTVCWWVRDSNGYSLSFIGDRPFKYEDADTLWQLMVYGQKVLDAKFELEGNT